MEEKRNIPKWLRFVLNKDISLTKYFINKTKDLTLFKSFKYHHQMFEISCHGILWLSLCLASIWVLAMPSLYRLQVNVLIALILDIIVVALMKALTRRRRPTPSTSMDFGPDKFSFPSGHASRSAMLMCIFLFVDPVPFLLYPPILAWTTSVCFSRVISQRHYLLDVCAGIALGVIESLFLSLIWLSDDSANYIVNSLSDEKIAGGEYHV